jgi:hypothetical protein
MESRREGKAEGRRLKVEGRGKRALKADRRGAKRKERQRGVERRASQELAGWLGAIRDGVALQYHASHAPPRALFVCPTFNLRPSVFGLALGAQRDVQKIWAALPALVEAGSLLLIKKKT